MTAVGTRRRSDPRGACTSRPGRTTGGTDGTDGTRSLQRCTLDGACKVVAPRRPRDQVDIPEGDDPYHLSTN